MTDRFNPSPVWIAHLKGLKNRKYDTARPVGVPDVVARVVLYGLPVGASIAMFLLDGKIAGADGLLGAAGIFTGALFMGFTQVAAWRQLLTGRQDRRAVAEVHQRDSLDEAVAHLLMAMYGSLAVVITIVVGRNFADQQQRLTDVPAAVTVLFATYTILLLLIVLPKLYVAYSSVNEVDDEMSGLSH